MGLWTQAQIEDVNRIAAKSKELVATPTKKSGKPSSINNDLNEMSEKVIEYFKDSEAILITNKQQLHDYITKAIESGYAGIDTETTGLDQIKDTIVGASLYYPGGVECYIPMRHLVPIFDEPYKNQLTYEEVGEEFQRLADSKIKLIFANANFDLSMIYKDLKVDLCDVCYYDVILAWRCMKEDEKDNSLKGLYNKYVLRGKGDPKKFADFFSPTMFPYCKPDVAKLYAANDAKITYELFRWQLPYATKGHPKCEKASLGKIADLLWNVELPLIKICQKLHRTGMFIDKDTAKILMVRYKEKYNAELSKLSNLVDAELQKSTTIPIYSKKAFLSGEEFNPNSNTQVKYLLYTVMNLPKPEGTDSTGKEVLNEFNLPVTNQILKVRSLDTLISTFVDKLPKATTPDDRIHAEFKQIGADCVVGNTLVPTPTGYKTIQQICESHHCKEAEHTEVDDVVIINKDQVPESAQTVIKYTDYPTIKITTECGFIIEGTYNHPVMVSKYTMKDEICLSDKRLSDFWTDRQFKTLEELKVGDFIEIPCNYVSQIQSEYQPTKLELSGYNRTGMPYRDIRIPKTYDEDFAEFLGMYHADGSARFRSGSYEIRISNDDPDVIERVKELSLKLFNLKSKLQGKPNTKHSASSCISCKLIGMIDGILSHKKQLKKMPEAIFRSPVSVINSYIKGLTLDSTVCRDKTGRATFLLSVCNDIDARFIQMHLASQGILCKVGYNYNDYGKSPRLRFNADNYMLFRDTIGFVESRKYMETESCAHNCYDSRRIGDSFRLSIRSIEYSTNTVYDLHIPGTHSFISNGFISHNTGRFSSAAPKQNWALSV